MNWSPILFPVIWLWRPKIFLTLLLFGGAAYLLIVFNWSYSDGDRAGFVDRVDVAEYTPTAHTAADG